MQPSNKRRVGRDWGIDPVVAPRRVIALPTRSGGKSRDLRDRLEMARVMSTAADPWQRQRSIHRVAEEVGEGTLRLTCINDVGRVCGIMQTVLEYREVSPTSEGSQTKPAAPMAPQRPRRSSDWKLSTHLTKVQPVSRTDCGVPTETGARRVWLKNASCTHAVRARAPPSLFFPHDQFIAVRDHQKPRSSQAAPKVLYKSAPAPPHRPACRSRIRSARNGILAGAAFRHFLAINARSQ